ncbi:arsenite efflux transporter metallochaperone ArsD [Bacillus sp. Marseille-P3661]|uniref:arsenite efflux transporter metallochaperone ArsD n=1 Tax=Bacillus sp. Marseille-P3661 TaxID=1936234 RepID=UPI000C822FC9|nr:arsenite efflux transporter metallochaperone ArsD [Bacillus sp. Marseille-P3661]
MKSLEVFDPAMCCPTGVCGPSVDPELARVASALFLLESKGLRIKRYNLGSEPSAFIENEAVSNLLNEKGPDVLPIVLLDGKVVKDEKYPSNEELAQWFELDISELSAKKSNKTLI